MSTSLTIDFNMNVLCCWADAFISRFHTLQKALLNLKLKIKQSGHVPI
jgi:hypothetical protein